MYIKEYKIDLYIYTLVENIYIYSQQVCIYINLFYTLLCTFPIQLFTSKANTIVLQEGDISGVKHKGNT